MILDLQRFSVWDSTIIKDSVLMTCAADLPHSTSSDAVHAIIRIELEKIKSISEDEVNAICNGQLHSMYSVFYNRSSMANSFGQAFAHTNDPLLYPKLIKDIGSVSPEDIQAHYRPVHGR